MLHTMAFDKYTCLNSMKHGGITRGMNNSCIPNGYVKKWEVCDYSCVVMFENLDIQLGE